MSYFHSAREAARVLGIPLLLREEPDPRAFRRHDWLGTLAVPAASAARMYVLASEEMSRVGGTKAGAATGTLGSSGAIWVTGPWGSLAHLPWAVGLADHLARARGRAGLLERELDGPLRTLARAGRRIPIRLPLAEALLGGPVDAVNTDLEGVSIFMLAGSETPVEGRTTVAPAVDFPVVLADGLPEALEGPYPGADWVAGVILVASFRDHSRFELDAVVRRLRETGHRLLGMMAIGPDVSEAEEAAALRADESALPTSANVSAPSFANAFALPVDAVLPAVESSLVVPLAPVGPPGPEPESKPEPEPPDGPQVEMPPETTATTGPETRPGGPSAPRAHPATIPLFSTWDRLTIGRSRRRRRAEGVVTALLVLAAAVAFYGALLRPRLRQPSWPSVFHGLRALLSSERVDSSRAVDSAVADSAASAADSIEAATARTATGAESTGAALTWTATGAESTGPAPAWTATRAESTRAAPTRTATGVESTGNVIDTGSVAEDSVRRSGERSGSKLRQPGLGVGVSDTMASLAAPSDVGSEKQFVIHLTSFKLMPEAEIEVATLRSRGIEARSTQVEIPDRGTWYRIVTGNFATFAEAESVALRLQAEGKIPYAHIAADGGRGLPVPVGTLDRARP